MRASIANPAAAVFMVPPPNQIGPDARCPSRRADPNSRSSPKSSAAQIVYGRTLDESSIEDDEYRVRIAGACVGLLVHAHRGVIWPVGIGGELAIGSHVRGPKPRRVRLGEHRLAALPDGGDHVLAHQLHCGSTVELEVVVEAEHPRLRMVEV